MITFKRRNIAWILIILVVGNYTILILNIGTNSSKQFDDEVFFMEDMANNLVKSPNFENLSDWIFFGTTSNSLEQLENFSGIILYNIVGGSDGFAQTLQQVVDINQKSSDTVTISVWSKADLILSETNGTQIPPSSEEFCLYVDLSLQSGRELWGYSKMLPISSIWQKTELKLDTDEITIKTVNLYIIFNVPGILKIRGVSITESTRIPVFHVNKSLDLSYIPFTCVELPEETMSTPILASAVILNWKRPLNLLAIVCTLLHYPFLTEIFVWNNNLNFSLQIEHFINYNEKFTPIQLRERTKILMKKIRIMNSPNNIETLGRWVACSQAENDICYTQDDDFEPCYLKSLYANLQSNPNIVHAVTLPSINLEQRRWMLWNPTINLHASFAWLGAGSFVPKQLAQKFLHQLSRYTLEAEQLLYADMIFSLWTNDPPYKLSVPLKPLFPGKVGFSDTHDHWKLFFYSINRASRILHEELSKNRLTSIFNHKQSYPLHDYRDAQTVCYNDKCLLMTNHQMFVPFESSVTYDASMSVREQDMYYPSPTYLWFDQYGYFHAVDGNKNTIWQIVNHKKNETLYFGLDLLRVHSCYSIYIYSSNFTKDIKYKIQLHVSINGYNWKQAPLEVQLTEDYHRLKVLQLFPISLINDAISYRFFRIYFQQISFPLFINEIEAKCSPIVDSKSINRRTAGPMVTVTFLSWKRSNQWSRLFYHMSKYQFIDEIIFWNNNPNITFNHSLLSSYINPDRKDISLKIINSVSNRFFFARFIACSMAKNEICLFQDDDWQIDQLNALYQNYLQYPHLLHTYTNPFVHYLCWTWSYMDNEVDVHTNFNWLGTGGLVSKQIVLQFIDTAEKLLPSDCLMLADMFFATWLNDHPYQLSVNLNEISSEPGFSAGLSGIARNKLYIWLGSNILHEQLKSNGSDLFSRKEKNPLWEDRFVRSPCVDDDCLFLTNIHAFPSPRQITTDFTLDFDGRAMQFEEIMPKQRLDDWLAHPYHHAVDNNDKSCYYVRNSSMNHYFGLDLFSVRLVKYLYIRYEGSRSMKRWLKQFILEYTSDRDSKQWNIIDQFYLIHIDKFWAILSFSNSIEMKIFRLKCNVPTCVDYRLCHLSVNDDFNLNPCFQFCSHYRSSCLSTNSTLCQKCYCN